MPGIVPQKSPPSAGKYAARVPTKMRAKIAPAGHGPEVGAALESGSARSGAVRCGGFIGREQQTVYPNANQAARAAGGERKERAVLTASAKIAVALASDGEVPVRCAATG